MNIPSMDAIKMDKILGKGSFAEVWSVQFDDPVHGITPMAAKVFPKSLTNDKRIANEVNCWKLVSGHSNIVELKYVISTDTHTYVLQEAITGYELFDIVVSQWEDKGCGMVGLSEGDTARYFSQLISAVLHMHSQGVAHRDIKTENIMIEQHTDSVKLIDFGLACQQRITDSRCGTMEYCAPEILRDKNTFDAFCTDTWACGIVLFIMLTGRLPFSGRTDAQTKRSILAGVLDYPSSVNTEARSLIGALLEPNPSKRMTLQQAQSHPFMAKP
jgi:5'-AMP-activated protein kinase catalytic alpha subunit